MTGHEFIVEVCRAWAMLDEQDPVWRGRVEAELNRLREITR